MDRNRAYGITDSRSGQLHGAGKRASAGRHSLLFSSLLFSSLIIFSLGLATCTGNGESVDSGGEVYNPNGTPVSSSGSGASSGSSGASGGSSGSFTAQELMDAITAGDAGRIIQLVSQTDSAASETQTVSMSAADLGLPAGGMVVLRIDEIGFLATAEADADGFVRFEVPKIETNSWVTVELSVQDSGRAVLWYGSDTQQVKDGGNLEVKLKRQYWTLTPGSIAVSATSYSHLYDPATWESDATTLSVTGLESAPAGSSFTYEWKDESGNVIGSGATLTQEPEREQGQLMLICIKYLLRSTKPCIVMIWCVRRTFYTDSFRRIRCLHWIRRKLVMLTPALGCFVKKREKKNVNWKNFIYIISHLSNLIFCIFNNRNCTTYKKENCKKIFLNIHCKSICLFFIILLGNNNPRTSIPG